MGKKVTVVGAGFYGSTTAQRLAEYDVFETVVITDIVEGKPAGLALDLNQSRAVEGFETKSSCTTGPTAMARCHRGLGFVVITAACRAAGHDRMDRWRPRQYRPQSRRMSPFPPNAVVIVLQPVGRDDRARQLATHFPKNRCSVRRMLDTARFTNFVAER